MTSRERPSWQLPAGVSRGTWDYVNDSSIATEYDRFHAGHPLLDLDRSLVEETLPKEPVRPDGTPRMVIDVGCGPGRNLLPLAERGFRVVGVDLSREMLKAFQSKAEAAGIADRCGFLLANMTDLSCIADRSADALLCLYSSMGMVQGRENRRSFLQHVARILVPEGQFIVHVHNRGSWLRDPGGIRRTIGDWIRSKRDRGWDFGDRIYPYRGLPSMFLHIYSERELKEDLESSGLQIMRFLRLDRESKGYLKSGWFAHVRAGGFMAVARRSQPVA